MTIAVSENPAPSADSTFDLRRVLCTWSEGSKVGQRGAPATIGETTWNARFFSTTAVATNLWAVPGGEIGTDFSATVSASTMIRGGGGYSFASSNVVADVQSWLWDASSNFGWVMMTESEGTARTARRFYSRQQPYTNDIARLTIEFTIPPYITLIEESGDLFRFTFDAENDRGYVVEFAPGLPSNAWQTLTNIVTSIAFEQITVFDTRTNGPQRYYRIRAQ